MRRNPVDARLKKYAARQRLRARAAGRAKRGATSNPVETLKKGSSGGFSWPRQKEMRSVKKTSSSVLTSNPGLAYKPAIETAPPLSGASSALPKDAEAGAGSPDGFLSEFD